MSYQKFAKYVFTIGFLDFLATAQGLIFLSLITKSLGAADYGIFAQMRVAMSLAIAFTFFGLHEALIRFVPGEKSEEKVKEGIYSSFFLILAANLVISLCLMVFSSQVAAFFKFDQVFVRLLALIIIFESLNTILLVAMRSLRDLKKYFWIVATKLMFEICLVVAVVLLGYGILGAIISLLIIRIAVLLVLAFYLVGKISFTFPDFSLLKKYLGFSLPTVVDGISYWFITSLDRFLIGFFLGIVFVGYYVPAYSMGSLLVFFIFPMAFMLSNTLPKLFDENNVQEVKNYLKHSLKFFSMAMIPSAFGLSFLSYQLLLVFSTQDIASKAFFVVPFVAFSILCYGITILFSQVLSLAKRTKIIASVWLAAALLNFILNLFLIPSLGILGAALATFFAYLLALFLMQHFASQELTFTIEWSFVSKAIGASVVMSFIIMLIPLQGVMGLVLEIIIGGIVYLALILILGGLNKKEINFFKSLITMRT